MGEKQYSNGPLLDHGHSSISKALLSKKAQAYSWIKNNIVGLGGIAVAAGVLTLLPVTRGQLAEVEERLNGKIAAVSQQVGNHDSAIAEIKSTNSRIDAKTDAILLKLTPERYSEVPPSSPPIEKPKPAKAKREHAQRSPIAKALGVR